ncbi:cysteine hydrolase family protein [Pseudoalteromonas sp. ZZD1]|uniref:cysteine hydrolase family protein n=1 Tax=Pseudoalteromonas sp. ZZD1 TaxID=3139395 RepID=UPI003BAA64FF
MTTTTLRNLKVLTQTPASLAHATLILVDYQNTYTQGIMELENWQPALDSAAHILARARSTGTTVIHVIHDGGPGTPYDIESEIGAIHASVVPIAGEAIVVKNYPDGFIDTDLAEHVDAAGHKNVIIIGFMTHMCVTYTTHGAFLRGNQVTVIADACATRALSSSVAQVSAIEQHQAALAAMSDLFAVVVPTIAELSN